MSAPNLELVPLDRRAGHALIAGSVQVGRCVVPMRSSSQAAAAWQALMAPAGRDERAGCGLWADVPPAWNRPSCQATAAQPESTLAHRHHCSARPAARRVPRGRGGRGGATCAAAAAQLAVGHGARRRAQPRPEPLPLCFRSLWLSAGPQHTHPPAGHAGAERGFCIDVARGVSECLDTLSCAQINNIELVRRSRFL